MTPFLCEWNYFREGRLTIHNQLINQSLINIKTGTIKNNPQLINKTINEVHFINLKCFHGFFHHMNILLKCPSILDLYNLWVCQLWILNCMTVDLGFCDLIQGNAPALAAFNKEGYNTETCLTCCFVCGFSLENISLIYGDVNIAFEGPQNLGLCSQGEGGRFWRYLAEILPKRRIHQSINWSIWPLKGPILLKVMGQGYRLQSKYQLSIFRCHVITCAYV